MITPREYYYKNIIINTMSLITLRPVREVGNFQSAFDQFFNDRFFSSLFRDTERSLDYEGWSLAADIYETSDELAYTVELPGFEKDQIEISVNDGNKIWSMLERSRSSFKAGVGESTIIDATGKFKKLKGTKCVYAVTKFKKSSFVKEKCKLKAGVLSELKD